jgi:CheY-like chemotaxis protein
MAHTGPVLLVESENDIREGLQLILQLEGWTVIATSDPRDALNALAGGLQPCIILLDLMSPAMNAVDFHRELRSEPRFQTIPVVAYAGLTDVRERARQLAVDASSDVPAEIDRLLAAVRQRCSV